MASACSWVMTSSSTMAASRPEGSSKPCFRVESCVSNQSAMAGICSWEMIPISASFTSSRSAWASMRAMRASACSRVIIPSAAKASSRSAGEPKVSQSDPWSANQSLMAGIRSRGNQPSLANPLRPSSSSRSSSRSSSSAPSSSSPPASCSAAAASATAATAASVRSPASSPSSLRATATTANRAITVSKPTVIVNTFFICFLPLRRSDFDRAPSIPSQPFNNLKGI